MRFESGPLRPSRGWLGLSGLLVGCRSGLNPGFSGNPGEAAHGLAERVAREATRIPGLIGPNEILVVAILITVAAMLGRIAAGLVHGLWRLGFDVERRLGRWLLFVKIALGLGVIYATLSRWVAAAPILTGGALVLFFAVGMSTLRSPLESLVVGLELAVRSRFRPGDHLTVGSYSGTVREIGITSVRLRALDGTTVFLPNRLLNAHATMVTRADNTARVVVEIPGLPRFAPEAMQRIRQMVILSPYRSIGSALRIEQHQSGTLEIEFQAHSSLLVADAAGQVRGAVESLSPFPTARSSARR